MIEGHYYFVAAEFSYGYTGKHSGLKSPYEVKDFILKQKAEWAVLSSIHERPKNFVLLKIVEKVPFGEPADSPKIPE